MRRRVRIDIAELVASFRIVVLNEQRTYDLHRQGHATADDVACASRTAGELERAILAAFLDQERSEAAQPPSGASGASSIDDA